MDQKILDACCGGRGCWFDKYNEDVLFQDIMDEECNMTHYITFMKQ